MSSIFLQEISEFGARLRSALLAGVVAAVVPAASALAQSAIPTDVPKGTKLVVADQRQNLQVLFQASGQQKKLASDVTFADFRGGPAILEAFRGGALDLATVGDAPPIQAHAAGVKLPIVAARLSTKPQYQVALRPGLKITRLQELKGKRIAYAEGTAVQTFVLSALKKAGLSKKDVTLVPLRIVDFSDALRSGEVDVATLNEPPFSHYIKNNQAQGAGALPASELQGLPTYLGYLYASDAALKNPAKAAAIRDFITRWIQAVNWAQANRDQWIDAYFVKSQKLSAENGRLITESEGDFSFPLLSSLVGRQQQIIDLIHQAGELPKRLDAKEEFDFRFDQVIDAANR
ncbi:ABC transporter substrate-binding protein [Pigmentiphaga soli]|uniref:ABC transporter substrate-binding protein n=1 Tax=Pigmentiphaga soli TaxID=1007095 RepID=A0ABP8HSC8_9BURK